MVNPPNFGFDSVVHSLCKLESVIDDLSVSPTTSELYGIMDG